MTTTQQDMIRVELDADGGVHYGDGTADDQHFATTDEARQAVINAAAMTAADDGHAVRLEVSDPTGTWPLLVHPDGHVDLDETPAPEPTHQTIPATPEPVQEAQPVEAAAATAATPEPALVPEAEPIVAQPAPVAQPVATAAVEEPQQAPEAAPQRAAEQSRVPAEDHTTLTAAMAQAAVDGPAAERGHSFITRETIDRPAEKGWRGAMNQLGLRLAPGAAELAERADEELVSQHFVGARTVVMLNGKGGAGKTPLAALMSAVFARYGGGGVLAWDVNQLRGTLGWRTEQASHDSTVLDLVPALQTLSSSTASLAELSGYVHHQSEDRYDVLRSQPLMLAEEQRLKPWVVDDVWRLMTRFYRMVIADTGNDESDSMWRGIVAHADQIVVTTDTRGDRAEAGRLLLEALRADGGRSRALAENAVVIITLADPHADKKTIEAIRSGFEPLAREVVVVPHDPAMVDGQLRWSLLRPATQRACLAAGAAIARGL